MGVEAVSDRNKYATSRILNLKKAAVYIGCGRTWLYNHIHSLPFAYIRTDYGIRFDTADLDDYLSKCKVLPFEIGKIKKGR
jgi:predicted DNA-binding transcriptional regulator AlpA